MFSFLGFFINPADWCLKHSFSVLYLSVWQLIFNDLEELIALLNLAEIIFSKHGILYVKLNVFFLYEFHFILNSFKLVYFKPAIICLSSILNRFLGQRLVMEKNSVDASHIVNEIVDFTSIGIL